MDNELIVVMGQADQALGKLMGNARTSAIPAADRPLSGFGARLRLLRMERGWSLNELAVKSGLSKSHIHHLEESADGPPTVKTAMALALAFGVGLDDLLDFRPRLLHRCPICRGDGWLTEDAV